MPDTTDASPAERWWRLGRWVALTVVAVGLALLVFSPSVEGTNGTLSCSSPWTAFFPATGYPDWTAEDYQLCAAAETPRLLWGAGLVVLGGIAAIVCGRRMWRHRIVRLRHPAT